MLHQFKPGPTTTAWSPLQWKILLGTTEDHVAKEGLVMAEQQSIVKELLGKCLDFHGLSLAEAQKSLLLTWHDHKYKVGQLTDLQLVKRIVWELYELNFRFEFHSLDGKFCGSSNPLSMNMDVQACFAGCEIFSPTQLDTKFTDRGLAAERVRDQGLYFHWMCRVMKDWPEGMKAESFLAGRTKVEEYSDDELVAMEHWATKFYCQSFYEKFGWPPILPHRVANF
ncbi:hypothetical protein AAF712_015347 [Marasmius tenuissimus]|uniref:Uncharacterized protein n=1 Tax=Marasmius tenuissimus TaxID=585030 RepID=A0ABR2Z8H2_9AGAR